MKSHRILTLLHRSAPHRSGFSANEADYLNMMKNR